MRGPTHRTHEERSAQTQQKLIEAAIFCLHRYGYAATSTTLVAEVAELSRGAMVHHFGAKVDLMLAVARYVVDDQNRFMDEALRELPRGVERFVGLTEITWNLMSQPGAIIAGFILTGLTAASVGYSTAALLVGAVGAVISAVVVMFAHTVSTGDDLEESVPTEGAPA